MSQSAPTSTSAASAVAPEATPVFFVAQSNAVTTKLGKMAFGPIATQAEAQSLAAQLTRGDVSAAIYQATLASTVAAPTAPAATTPAKPQ